MSIFAFLIALTAFQRISELLLSWNNRKTLTAEGFKSREATGSTAEMIAMHTAWFVGLVAEPLYLPRETNSTVTLICVIAFFAAQILRVWTLITLGRHWNIAVMAPVDSQIRGTTADHTAPSLFVSSGPYRWIRHPNYLVVISELLLLPLIGGAYMTAVIISAWNALVLKRRIAREEVFLFARPGYGEAMGKKKRFIPNVF